MKKYLFFSGLILLLIQGNTQKFEKLTSWQVYEDIEYFKNVLYRGHVNLASIANLATVDSMLQAIEKKYQDTGTYRYKLFTQLLQVMHVVNDIHSSLKLPEKYNDYYQLQGKYLPMHVYYEKGHMRVEHMLHDSLQKYQKKRIVSINGISEDSLIQALIKHTNIDGNDSLVMKKIASLYFFSLYPLLFACRDSNVVVVQIDNHSYDTLILPGIVKKHTYFNEKKEDFFQKTRFIYNHENAVGYLKVPSFMDFLNYKTFLRDVFVFLQKHKAQYLILDLRDNGGGVLSFAKMLLAYLVTEETEMIDYITTKSSYVLQRQIIENSMLQPELTRFFSRFGGKVQQQLWKKEDQQYGTFKEKKIKPSRYAFTGKLYVLMNSYCASATGLVLNVLSHRPSTLFFGTPAVCSVTGSFGNPTKFTLPHSRIEGTISAIFIKQNTQYYPTNISQLNINPHIFVEDADFPTQNIKNLFTFLQQQEQNSIKLKSK